MAGERVTAHSAKPIPLLERAYQLARSGGFSAVGQISRQLRQEGYRHNDVSMHLEGRSLTAELKRLCRAAMKRETGA